MPFTRLSVPLANIACVSALNPRAHDDSDVSSMAATIRAVGLVHPLVVRPCDDAGWPDENQTLEVLAGSRRWRALRQIAAEDAGAGSGQPRVRIDQIPVYLVDGDDADAREAILAVEGEVAPVHPADLYEVFRQLGDDVDVARIARDFGKSERDVRRILALGHMAPEIRAAWREGRIKREIADAFASADSAEAQAALLKTAEKHETWLLHNPHEIRRRLRGDVLPGDCSFALYVGADAYAAAGGRLDEDLFSEVAGVLYRDGSLLQRLAREKMMREAEAIAAAEGWGISAIDGDDGDDLREDWSLDPDYSDEEQGRLEQIDTEIRDAAPDVARELRAEADQIEARGILRRIAAAERQQRAVMVGLDADGCLQVTRGMLRLEARARDDGEEGDGEYDEDSSPSPRARGEGRGEGPGEEGDDLDDDAPPPAPPLTNGQRTALDAAATHALADCARTEIGRALTLAVAAMSDYGPTPGVHIKGRPANETEHPLLLSLQDVHGFRERMALCAAAPLADVTTAFAELVAAAIDTVGVSLADVEGVALALTVRGADIGAALRRHFEPAAWFEATNKDGCVAALRQMDGDAVGANKAKKPVAAAMAAKLAQDKAWLPSALAEIAGEPLAPVEPPQSLADAMAEAIENDEADRERKTLALAVRIAPWLQQTFLVPEVPGKRIEKLYVAHRRYQAAEDTICGEDAFRAALQQLGFEIRAFRNKDWIFTTSATADLDTRASGARRRERAEASAQ